MYLCLNRDFSFSPVKGELGRSKIMENMNTQKMKEQFDLIAQKYDNNRRCFIPCFDDYYKRSVSLLKYYKKELSRVVDLGAGTGLLTKEIYELYPDAHFTLVDIADEMLDVARQRFAGLSNFDYLSSDYIENFPAEKPDLICSALSIHHLDAEEKIKLYSKIYAGLDAGGCFLNLDQFVSDSSVIDKMYSDWWMDYIQNSGISEEQMARGLERRALDKENSVETTVALLQEAGFSKVECMYRFMKFGVVLAIK